MKIISKIFAIVVISVVFYLGFTQSEPCGVDGGASIYCFLHPFTFVDGLGLTFFTFGALVLCGWGSKWIELLDVPVDIVRWLSFITMVIGVILTLL